MDKKKIFWTLTAVAMVGITAYALLHTHPTERSCLFCAYPQLNSMIGFVTGLCVLGTIYAYQNN